jgi:hypothetical protein
VTLNVGRLQRAQEVATILELSGLSSNEVKEIVEGALSREDTNNDDDDGGLSLAKGEVRISPIGVKQLLMVLEMARSGDDALTPDKFLECLHTCGF